MRTTAGFHQAGPLRARCCNIRSEMAVSRRRGVGYVLSPERFPPGELIEYAVAAEAAGFDAVWASDHFHPWQDNQGHAGQAWMTLAAIGGGGGGGAGGARGGPSPAPPTATTRRSWRRRSPPWGCSPPGGCAGASGPALRSPRRRPAAAGDP